MSAKRGGRRRFLKTIAAAGGVVPGLAALETPGDPGAQLPAASGGPSSSADQPLEYPRVYSGRQLALLAFPLGGVAAGSLSLGGRGQLRDWEIFNRADKGASPAYAFPSIWVQSGNSKPVVRVLESRILPPYQGADGLGSRNAPGLHRLDRAAFRGEYPVAQITFQDSSLPVDVTLDAFSPFIPLDAEDSGLPLAILRYRVRNSGAERASVAIAFSIENPVGADDKRTIEYRKSAGLDGLLMANPALAAGDPHAGTFALCLVNAGASKLSYLRGWPKAKWWESPLLFWDDFSADGELGPGAARLRPVGSLCLKRQIEPGSEAEYTFLLSWRFPNRTPGWCGWAAPKGDENVIIGNHYCTRFADAWSAAEYAAGKLEDLEERTRAFVSAVRESTLPAAVKDAAMSNLSTLASTTCFRTADGVFRGFEGAGDQRGCCHGSCTHVWGYEFATEQLFPTLARSMREAAFRLSDSMGGAMPIRLDLPEGKQKTGFPAADGQMGQVIKAYLDWRLSGDDAWLRRMWPQVKRALEFAWIPGGWDANKDGVMEGVQHNTYDVEFYGPNPMCGIYYLAGLRAGEEMARSTGDGAAADEYRRLFDHGSAWIDANLFNGEYYVQKIQGVPLSGIAPVLRSKGGAEDPEHPDFQLGEGCLVDQLMGQYAADVAGLGPLVDPGNIRKTLRSIYRYNDKRPLADHDCVERVFALNDESALVICDYGAGKRPKTPFPYFAEVMTGFEYQAATLMLFNGMIREGIECIENIRRRYDGERRNPWDEAECGHHYARAMAAWSAVLALSGFRYHGGANAVVAMPRIRQENFLSFWSTATAWGSFSQEVDQGQLEFWLEVTAGELPVSSVRLANLGHAGSVASVTLGGRPLKHEMRRRSDSILFTLAEDATLHGGERITVAL